MDHRKIPVEQFIPDNALAACTKLLGQIASCCLKLDRAHVGRRGIDQVTRQEFASCNLPDLPFVNLCGQLQPCLLGLAGLVPIKPIGGESPRQGGFIRRFGGKSSLKVPNALRKCRSSQSQMKPAPIPGTCASHPHDGPDWRARVTGQDHQLTESSRKGGCIEPSATDCAQCFGERGHAVVLYKVERQGRAVGGGEGKVGHVFPAVGQIPCQPSPCIATRKCALVVPERANSGQAITGWPHGEKIARTWRWRPLESLREAGRER